MVINEKLTTGSMKDYIIESGDNYIKYKNGIMMQWGIVSTALECKTSSGAIYRTASAVTVNYPISFINNNVTATITPRAAFNGVYIVDNTANYFNFYPLSTVQLASANRYFNWIAIGKWK